jgi:hypothetical protein
MKNGYIAALLATLLSTAVADATPTPLPGGANQMKAQSGTVGKVVWNGAVRMTLVYLRDATPDETAASPPSPGKKNIVFEMKLRNGLNQNFQELVEYTLADKDDVTVSVPTYLYTNAALNILQGGAAVQKASFPVDADFVPVKMIAVCATCSNRSPFKTVRFSIPAAQSN